MFNAQGAANKLGCSVTWIRKLVARRQIKAHVYVNGVLVEHDPDNPTRGIDLFFQESDLDAYQPKVRRRPMGAKDKVGEDNPKRKEARKL